jgi:hypothetical protein
MKLMTSFENPAIPWRTFDWVAYDDDAMDVCADPDCNCRSHVVQAFGVTEEEAVLNFVQTLLEKLDISVSEMMEENHAENPDQEEHEETDWTPPRAEDQRPVE